MRILFLVIVLLGCGKNVAVSPTPTSATVIKTLKSIEKISRFSLVISMPKPFGICSGAVTIEVFDADSSQPFLADSPITMLVETSSTTAHFFSDNKCETPIDISSMTLDINHSSISFYIEDSLDETILFTVIAPPLITRSASGTVNAVSTIDPALVGNWISPCQEINDDNLYTANILTITSNVMGDGVWQSATQTYSDSDCNTLVTTSEGIAAFYAIGLPIITKTALASTYIDLYSFSDTSTITQHDVYRITNDTLCYGAVNAKDLTGFFTQCYQKQVKQ